MTSAPSSNLTDEPRKIVWDEATLARFWAYQARFPENYFSFQKGADLVRRAHRNLPQGSRVLDYGCGPGHLLAHLLDAGYRVTGADIALSVMGENQASLISRPGFEGLFTIDDLLCRNQTFDGVFLLEVVEHLDDYWLSKTLADAYRLLKPGGVLIVTTPNDERLEDSTVYCPVSNVVFHRWQHVRSWTAASLLAILQQHGFCDVSVRRCNFRESGRTRRSAVRRLVGQVLTRLTKPQSLLAVCTR